MVCIRFCSLISSLWRGTQRHDPFHKTVMFRNFAQTDPAWCVPKVGRIACQVTISGSVSKWDTPWYTIWQENGDEVMKHQISGSHTPGSPWFFPVLRRTYQRRKWPLPWDDGLWCHQVRDTDSSQLLDLAMTHYDFFQPDVILITSWNAENEHDTIELVWVLFVGFSLSVVFEPLS